MRFNLVNKSPINVNIDGKDYALPRFLRRDWIKWASEIDGEREAQATEQLDAKERAKMLLIYPLEPVSHQELQRRLHTVDGTGRIVRTCADRGGVPRDVIDKLLDEGDEVDLETLARLLASVVDPVELANYLKSQEGETNQGEGQAENPLASSTSESADSSKWTS